MPSISPGSLIQIWNGVLPGSWWTKKGKCLPLSSLYLCIVLVAAASSSLDEKTSICSGDLYGNSVFDLLLLASEVPFAVRCSKTSENTNFQSFSLPYDKRVSVDWCMGICNIRMFDDCESIICLPDTNPIQFLQKLWVLTRSNAFADKYISPIVDTYAQVHPFVNCCSRPQISLLMVISVTPLCHISR